MARGEFFFVAKSRTKGEEVTTPSSKPEVPYVLGTGIDELERLAFQHRLWSDTAHAAWRTARVCPGDRVLDVGCGPGYASFDLAQLVMRQGAVVGVDESPRFIGYLNHQAQVRELPQLTGRVGDVQNLTDVVTERQSFTVAYVRWVLCFVSEPLRVLQGIGELLQPGGRVVIHDYFHYQSIATAPRHPAHDEVVAATMASWRDRGGDTDIVGRLPRLLHDAGFELIHFQAHARAARSTDTMFSWPDTWWRTYTPKLVDMGYITAETAAALLEHFQKLKQDRTAFIQCPTVYELIAERRS